MLCGADFSGLSTYQLTASEREMSSPPALSKLEHGPLYFTVLVVVNRLFIM